ncbi:MAG: HEAT repeat domain-containing protein [bacterium]|nr:HEAT repeat domain-containing protein [bacterium]MDT8367086.1 HEAT repeat domain-containing protein [bacterium]
MTDSTTVALLVSELVRAFKAMAMYPAGHPSRERFFQKLQADFSSCLSLEPVIKLKVEGDAVTWSGEPLSTKDGSSQFLARECFTRQVSSLRFMRGLSAKDLEVLFELLAMDSVVIKGAGGAVELTRGKVSGSFQLEQVDYEGILGQRVEITGENPSRYASETFSPVAPPDEVPEPKAANLSFRDDGSPEINQEEWLAGKLRELDKAGTVAQYKLILSDILTRLRETGGMEIPGLAAAVLKHLGKYLLKQVPDEISKINRESIRLLARPPALEEMVAQLTMRDQPDREVIQAVLYHTHDLSISVLLQMLADENEAFGRRTIISFLGRFGDALRPHLDKWLRDDRWYVVRNALGLLQEVGGQKDSANVRTYLQHPHPKIRLEALRFLYRFPIPVDERLMNRLLDDADLEVQARAVYALGVLQGTGGLQRLMALAKKPFFGEGDVNRRAMAVKGIAREGGDRSIQFLSGILKARSFLNPSGRARVQKSAVDGLVEIGGARSVKVLRRSLSRLKGEAFKTSQEFLRREGGEEP